MAQVEVIKVASVTYQIERISTEDEDCWRDIDEERIQEIKTNIKDGNWGASVLQFARLLGDEDGKIIASDLNGLPKVLDGNHIVRVLIELKKEWEACKNAGEAEEKGEDPSWLKAGLKKQFEEGFEFAVFAFVGVAYDEVIHKVWCGHAHEEEQSNVLHTTIWHRHKTCRLLYERHGQNWPTVQKELTKLLGGKSRRSVATPLCFILGRAVWGTPVCRARSLHNGIGSGGDRPTTTPEKDVLAYQPPGVPTNYPAVWCVDPLTRLPHVCTSVTAHATSAEGGIKQGGWWGGGSSAEEI